MSAFIEPITIRQAGINDTSYVLYLCIYLLEIITNC
jgi:hypothetical protein